ncbi:MAG: hypothetical protein OXN25_05345 [Candidatus Poribacteria bacterium]|nr:hypothetical protein [Candidatus Poribacteria bacterium]
MRTHNTPAIMLLVLLSLLFVGRTAHAETPQEQKPSRNLGRIGMTQRRRSNLRRRRTRSPMIVSTR